MRLRQGGRRPLFSGMFWPKAKTFRKKEKNVPCCRRRIGRSDLTPGRNRLPPRNSCQSQELRGHEPERKFRLRQGGTDHPFWKKSGSERHFFSKKIENVPCCRRRGRLPSGQTSGLNVHRVSPVNHGITRWGFGPRTIRNKRKTRNADAAIRCLFPRLVRSFAFGRVDQGIKFVRQRIVTFTDLIR